MDVTIETKIEGFFLFVNFHLLRASFVNKLEFGFKKGSAETFQPIDFFFKKNNLLQEDKKIQ